MRTTINWLRILAGLTGVSVIMSTVIIGAANTSMTSLMMGATVLLIVIGTVFLVGFWLATLAKQPEAPRPTEVTIQTERRVDYELAELQEQLMQRDRIIFLLQNKIRRMQ
ncbi:MAG: hypothetical protein AAF653_16565, partial [Chloroflexota bacterium]